jgi:hypothetical protein
VILVENPSTRSFVVAQDCPTRGQRSQLGKGSVPPKKTDACRVGLDARALKPPLDRSARPSRSSKETSTGRGVEPRRSAQVCVVADVVLGR